ncbi:nuclear factor NF-kappa-B p105 subunit [Folsomia candida]|uniref:nuclear factor NF-kappa-B p105 subunit n=1 Tax=Folsomia candida TaxID=158441 RepID=UPI001605304D|nr:nuclear factor NF-kappa-B p105 subunit [Folsomia candida]
MEWESSSSDRSNQGRRGGVHPRDSILSSRMDDSMNNNDLPPPPSSRHRQSSGNWGKPHLEILVQPQPKFRFRYKSEMTGKHGSLLGVVTPSSSSVGRSSCTSTGGGYGTGGGQGEFGGGGEEVVASSFSHAPTWSVPSYGGGGGGNMPTSSSSMAAGFSAGGIQSKLFPTVKLHNFSGNAVIRVSLVCDARPHYPHPHLLEMGQSPQLNSGLDLDTTFSSSLVPASFSGESRCVDGYVEIPVSADNDYTAVFQGLNIIYIGKKESRRVLLNKMSQIGADSERKVTLEQLEDLALTINLNVVALFFEAIVRNPSHHRGGGGDNLVHLCPPVVSGSIQHNKSTQTGELRIVRIDKFSSCCTGNEEVFTLVEKVDKHNIQIKFYEESDKGVEIWKAYGKFSKLDVHHQYAIVFKTPPYRNLDIESEADVWIQLERPSDGATSQPIPFRYRPVENIRKMPKRQPRSRNEQDHHHNPNQRQFDPSMDRDGASGGGGGGAGNAGSYGGVEDNRNNPLAGPSNIRQGASSSSREVSFPCDTSAMASSSEDASQSKALAMSVALSICQGIHGWAETSDIGQVLQKLRHLLCLVNEHGDNALHSAIIHQQKEPFFRILQTLSAFPDTASVINEPNAQLLTPLHLAVLSNRSDFVTELLRHNADISLQNCEGETPLHIAVKANDISTVKYLLQAPTAPVAINKFNYASMSPLLMAVSSGNNEMVELLCSHKASLTAQEGTFGRTPLHTAVEKETKESIISTMIILKSAGNDAADLTNIQNYRGDTPLHSAAHSGFTTLCALLMHYGADPMVENHVRKETDEEEEDNNGGDNTNNSSSSSDDDRLSGQTVFDITSSDQVLRILKGTLDDWEIILKACSPLLLPSSPLLAHAGGGGDKDKDFESKCLDSGIDVNTFNSSQFLNSSSSNQL